MNSVLVNMRLRDEMKVAVGSFAPGRFEDTSVLGVF